MRAASLVAVLGASLGGMVVTAAAAAQTPSRGAAGSAEAAVRSLRPLSRAEEQAKLEELRAGLLTRMMPERVATGDRQKQRKWLNDFQVIQSEHYLLLTNGPTATCKKFAKTLEELHAFVKEQFPFEDADHLLRCYVFKDKSEYVDFCEKIVGWSRQSAEATAGHATASYYATYYIDPRADVVFHEATHQIVGACMKIGGGGSWFQEGMAVYVENAIKKRDPSSVMRADFKRGDYYPLEQLVALPSLLGDRAGNGRRNYRHAGALIDFLVNTKQPELAGRFPDFLRAARAQRGRSQRAAEAMFDDVYGMTLAEVETAWLREHGVKR